MTDPILPPLIETRKGRYRHSKGARYEVMGTVRHRQLYNSSPGRNCYLTWRPQNGHATEP